MRARTLPEASRTALEKLAADAADEGRAAFKAALRDHHVAGWSYRQLGNALQLSHEQVRKLISTAGDQASPISPPQEAPRKPAVLEPRRLPESITQELKARFDAALTPVMGPHPGPLAPAVAALYAGLAGAVAAGWNAYEIGTAVGIHPRAAGRFATSYSKQAPPGSLPVFEKAPDRGEAAWNARPPVAPPVTISATDRARLSELRDEAAVNRGEGNPSATEYTGLLTYWYLRGANREDLEQATGQQWDTLRRRLLRWGVMRDPRRA